MTTFDPQEYQSLLNKMSELEADMYASFENFGELYRKYSDKFYTLELSEENSETVNTFYDGLNSLNTALEALIQAFKIVSEHHGVRYPN
jgi:hypothetical protein